MFSQWLVIVAVVLTTSANPDRAAVAWGTVTVGPTSEVKGQPEAELTLNCGDGKSSGLVQYWHTPFGDLKRPGIIEPGPVLMRSDGTLVVSNCSRHHSGLYYCLLQDARGTTLWPYQVHVHPDHGGLQEVRVASRSRRVIRSDDGGDSVSQQDLAAAVAAAVLLTFVVGFSAGALSRTYVLRCLGAIRTRIRSPRQQSDQTDRSGVTMTTLPPWYGHEEAEPVDCDETMETTVSSITSAPPIKPQRSFRHKGDAEEEEPSVYLEGCGHVKEEEITGYLEGCGHVKEEEEGLEEEKGTYGGLYLSGGDEEEEEEERRREEKETQRREEEGKGDEEEEEERRRKKETQRRKEEEKEEGEEEEEERRREKETQRRKEEKGGGEEEEEERRREKETQWRKEEEKGDKEEEERRKEEKETQKREEEEKGDKEEEEERREKEETQQRKEEEKEGGEEEEEEERRREKETQSRHEEEGTFGGFYLSGEDEEEETKRRQEQKGDEEEKEEEEKKRRRQEEEEEVHHPHSEVFSEGGDTKPEAPSESRRRRSRVIRLYQYDEEGQRYGHLPDPAPDEPGPAPRLRQRSVSLTRLNAIMAAASAGPLDSEGDARRREETHFHMDI